MKLTDTQIKRMKLSTKPYKVSDGGGLFLWVTPSGGKVWRWTYRHEGRAKLMTFGKYPDVPLALARERHGEARKLLATGTDPMAERKAEKAAADGGKQRGPPTSPYPRLRRRRDSVAHKPEPRISDDRWLTRAGQVALPHNVAAGYQIAAR